MGRQLKHSWVGAGRHKCLLLLAFCRWCWGWGSPCLTWVPTASATCASILTTAEWKGSCNWRVTAAEPHSICSFLHSARPTTEWAPRAAVSCAGAKLLFFYSIIICRLTFSLLVCPISKTRSSWDGCGKALVLHSPWTPSRGSWFLVAPATDLPC